jgi:hypothetical protein
VFGPNMLLDNNGARERSVTCALILKADVSEKYTPPRFVGRLTGMGDFTIVTFFNGKVSESIHKTKSNGVVF